jgi:DNA mismatch repair ATPase MutS
MEIIKNINEKYNLKKYFESDDIKNCKDLLQEISNKNNNDTYTDVKLIKNCDKYNKFTEQTDNLYSDLEFFTDYKNGNKTIMSKLDKSYTKGGSYFLKQLLLNPSNNIDYLNLKKKSLQNLFKLIKNNENDILTKLENLKKYEKNVYWIMEQNSEETESLINILYFSGYVIKNLNKSSHALTAKNIFKIFLSPFIGVLSPILYILTPYLVIIYKLKVKINFITYIRFVYNYYVNMDFGNMMGNSKLDIFRKIWILFSLIFYFNGIFNSIELSKLCYKLNNLICTQMNGIIQYISNGHSLIKDIYNDEYFNVIFNKKIDKDTLLNNEYLLKFKNLENNNKNTYFSNFGEKLNLYKFIQKDLLKDFLNTTYLCDTIVNLYLIKNQYNLVYSEYKKLTKPLINITGLQHPNIDNIVKNDIILDPNNNLIITGPNAGGKSTFIKSIAINIILSQTLCVAFCDKIELTPFYYISSQMNIVDNKGSESLFEAEMNRIVSNVNIISECNKNNKFSILFLDELFNSTNVVEGICGSYSICKKLSEMTNNITLLTTHYTYLYKLKKTKRFKNYKMNAIVTNNNITFPYKLCKGYSKQFVALELLKNNSLLKNNNDLFIEAIKFKKNLLNLKCV